MVEGKLPDLATLCPYNDFCTTKATKTLKPNETDLMPCCQSCSCEPDCQLFGNCCPDKELSPYVQVKYPCIGIDQYYNNPRNMSISKVRTYDIYYHVINDCPTRKLLSEYPRCFKLQYLEDYAFVSDPLTGRVYQNKHCARCNGVFDYAEWYLSTDCSMISDVSLDEWLRLLYTSCEITPIPPEPSTRHPYRCFPPDSRGTRSCSSEWNTKVSEIKDACEYEHPATNDLFYQYVTDRVTLKYRNPYCKLCNAKNNWSDLCKPLLSSSSVKGLNIFAKLINLLQEEEIAEESTPQCKQTELWDPFRESCMAVACPAYSILLAGKCEEIYRRFPEETYVIYFSIESGHTVFSNKDIKAMHNVISDKLSNEHCHHCETRLMTDDHSYPYIRYQIRTQDSCSEEYLTRQVKLMIANPLVYVIPKGRSLARLSPDILISRNELNSTLDALESSICEDDPINVKHVLFDPCPRVSIEYLELNVTLYDDIDIRTEINGTMCVDEYFRIMQSMNGSKFDEPYLWVTIFVIIIAYCTVHI
ncbi:hypothetical protein ACF0H5_015584 [Mactra antiquata]